MRLDKLLFEKGLAPSRTKASAIISEGLVSVSGRTSLKPSEDVPPDAEIEVVQSDSLRYVGRGALKLKAALDLFGFNPRGLTAIDIGASTGGFTQCLLEYGAQRVFAVDSGHGQLAPALLTDSRVTSLEGFNAKGLTAETIHCLCGIAVMDVSFISQRLLYPAVSSVLEPGGALISLIKPQFEVGRKSVGGGGIVRNKNEHVRVILELITEASRCGLRINGLTRSPILGGDGNAEYLAIFRIGGETEECGREKVKKIVFGE